MRQPCTTVCDRARRYTILNGSRIAPYTEYRCLPFHHLAFLYDLRIQNPFPTVSLRVHASYTEVVHNLCISAFFSVNGRLRSCMFDLRSEWLMICTLLIILCVISRYLELICLDTPVYQNPKKWRFSFIFFNFISTAHEHFMIFLFISLFRS